MSQKALTEGYAKEPVEEQFEHETIRLLNIQKLSIDNKSDDDLSEVKSLRLNIESELCSLFEINSDQQQVNRPKITYTLSDDPDLQDETDLDLSIPESKKGKANSHTFNALPCTQDVHTAPVITKKPIVRNPFGNDVLLEVDDLTMLKCTDDVRISLKDDNLDFQEVCTMDATTDTTDTKDTTVATEIGSLFAVKKKSVKKMKITLEEETVEESEINIQKTPVVVKSNEETKNDPSSSKLDYAFEESTTDKTLNANNELANAINEYDTEYDRDHLTRRKEALKRSKDLAAKGELDTKYRGLKGYQQFLMQGDTARANAGSDKNHVAGPVRASANLRVTSRFDYKPDLCKDYNETGFCGFGDSCIFLHDRTEHKSSYDLEKEWEAEQKRKELEAENKESLVKEVTEVAKPTHCAVCSKPFTRPVKTKCGHFFCESCVLRSQKCPTCKAALLGSFKPASKELSQ